MAMKLGQCYMKTQIHIILSLLTIILAGQPASADQPPRIVDRTQQAGRDAEKLTILQNEINTQRDLASKLQQKRAIALSTDNKADLADIESRIEEVVGNIGQIQQEIDLAKGQGGAIKTATVQLSPIQQTPQTQTAQPNNPTGQWWDLYNKKGARK